MIRAVIFDMDGVLTDSEKLGVSITCEVAREMGFEIPESVVLKTLGITWAASVRFYEDLYPGLDIQEMFSRIRERELHSRWRSYPIRKRISRISKMT